ncbi:uncharacterized protein Dvir_GJ25915 [Drosophila virilis]|uniref:Uncharacterized protein n=1 Tax=Drosophila virilis TaxID=7244 RepID=A0A0Q9WIZ4_DROVI|nr:uncharacterized protein Dvir_GJ25915 [Drosophila virilis]
MYFGWQHCTTNQLSRAFVLLMCLSINNVAMIVSLRKCSTCLLGSGLGLDIYHQVVLAIIPSSRCTTSRASRATCVSPCAYVVIFGLTHPGIRRLRIAYVSVGLHVLSPFANGLHIIALLSLPELRPTTENSRSDSRDATTSQGGVRLYISRSSVDAASDPLLLSQLFIIADAMLATAVHPFSVATIRATRFSGDKSFLPAVALSRSRL